MPFASELHTQYPYIAPQHCSPPQGFDLPLLSLSFPLRYALDQFHLSSAAFRALDQSRIIAQLYNLQVSAIESGKDEVSLLLAAYDYLVSECQKVDPFYAQDVLDDLIVLQNGQLEGERKQALIYINTSTVSKDSYSSIFSVYTDDRTDSLCSNLREVSSLTHVDQYATMSDPHIHSPLRLGSVLGAPNPRNISALVFKIIVVILAGREKVYTLLLPQTPILEMSSRHLREFGSRHFLRVEFTVPRSASTLSPQRPVSVHDKTHQSDLPVRSGSVPNQKKHRLNKKPVIAEEKIQYSIVRAGFSSLINRRFARPTQSAILKRAIYNILTNGIYLGGSLFIYYAQGSGQLKEQQCWFIRAPDYRLMYKHMQHFAEFIKNFKYYQSFYANLSSKLHSFYVSPVLPSITHLDSILNKFIRPRAVIFREFAIKWLGTISELQACKICTRRGLCFGKSLPTIKVKEQDVHIIPDRQYHDYVFTDGAGEISYDLMLEIAVCLDQIKTEQLNTNRDIGNFSDYNDDNEGEDGGTEDATLDLQTDLKVLSNSIQVPSALQMRWAGAKGVLILNALLPPRTILLHKSQVKFTIPNPTETQQTLEVLRVAYPSRGMINMQIIVLLSEMGVPDEVFLNLVHQDLQKALVFSEPMDRCRHQADLYQLVSRASRSSSGKLILQMLMAGVDITEPCLQFVLMKLQMMQLRSMKANMRFSVPDSRILIGIYDCFNLLKEGEVYIGLQSPLVISKWVASTHLKAISDAQHDTSISLSSHPHIFDMASEFGPSCVEGRVVVAKNPCFYRGDVRVYQAVNLLERLKREASEKTLVPSLPPFVTQEAIKAMYKGVICFPQYYEGRPMADCLSGSDLDGDIYWVSWDASIIGTIQYEYEPASFQANSGEINTCAPNLEDVEAGLGNLLRNESATNSSRSNWPSLQELKLEQFYNLSHLLRKNYVSSVLEDQCSRGVDLENKKVLYSKVDMQPVELIIKEAFILDWVAGTFFDKTIGKIGSELKIVGDMLGYSHPLTIELGRQFFFAIDADKTGWRRRGASSARKLLTLSFKKLCQSSQEELEADCFSESSDFLLDCNNKIDDLTHYATDVYASSLNELTNSVSDQCSESTDSSCTADPGGSDSSHGGDGSLRFIFSDTEELDGDAGEPHLKLQSSQQTNFKQGLEQELCDSSLVAAIPSKSPAKKRVTDIDKRILLQSHSFKMKKNHSEDTNVVANSDVGRSPKQRTKDTLSVSAITSAYAALTQLVSLRKKSAQASDQVEDKQVRTNFSVAKASILPNWMIGSITTGLFYPTENDWIKLKHKIIYRSNSVIGSIYNLLTNGEDSSISILQKCISSSKGSFFQAVIDTLCPISTVLPSNLAQINNSIESTMGNFLSPFSVDLSQLAKFSTKSSLLLLGIQDSIFQRQIDISMHIFGSVIADFKSISQRGRLHADARGSAYSRMVSIYSWQMRSDASDEERRARAVILYYLFYMYALIQLLPTLKYYEQMHGAPEIQDVYSNSGLQIQRRVELARSASVSSDASTCVTEEADSMSQLSSDEYRPTDDREHKPKMASTSHRHNSKDLIMQYLDCISTARALIGIPVSPDDRLAWSRHAALPLYKTAPTTSIVLCNRYSTTGIQLSEEDSSKLGGFPTIPAFSDIGKCLKTLIRKKLSILPSILPSPQQPSNEDGTDRCAAHHLSIVKLSCDWPVSITNPTLVFARHTTKDNTLWLWENTWKAFLKAQLMLLQALPQDLRELPVSALKEQNVSSESQHISLSETPSSASATEESLCKVHRELIAKTFNDDDIMVLQEQLNSMIQVHTVTSNASRNSTPFSSCLSSDSIPSTVLSEDTPVSDEQDDDTMRVMSDDGNASYAGEPSDGTLDTASAPVCKQTTISFRKMRPIHTLLPTGKLFIKDRHNDIAVSLKPVFFTRNSLMKIHGSLDIKSSQFTRSYALLQRRYIDALQICQLVWDICGPELCEAFARCRHQYIHAVSPELISFVSVRPNH